MQGLLSDFWLMLLPKWRLFLLGWGRACCWNVVAHHDVSIMIPLLVIYPMLRLLFGWACCISCKILLLFIWHLNSFRIIWCWNSALWSCHRVISQHLLWLLQTLWRSILLKRLIGLVINSTRNKASLTIRLTYRLLLKLRWDVSLQRWPINSHFCIVKMQAVILFILYCCLVRWNSYSSLIGAFLFNINRCRLKILFRNLAFSLLFKVLVWWNTRYCVVMCFLLHHYTMRIRKLFPLNVGSRACRWRLN